MADLLSQDLWELILQHVPLGDRLECCALVCKKLSKAAATVSLEVSLPLYGSQEHHQQLAEAFDSYLQHHGRHLTSLVLPDCRRQPLMQLPCPRLLHLDISHGNFQLGPYAGLPGVLGSCTRLTCLKLSDCTMIPAGGLSSLSVLVDLRDLHICNRLTLPGSVLPSLSHLTHLHLFCTPGVENVHHVSSLTNLCVLHMRNVYGPVRLAPDIAPGFALPASLRVLELGFGVVLDPAVLSATTQLTSLELCGPEIERAGGGVSSGAALLAAVGALQQVVSLELSWLEGVDWPVPSAAYTALTASSKLQRLAVYGCGLPESVWVHAFPSARRCPAMRAFVARVLSEDRDETRLDGEDVSSLVWCCPGLQELNVCVRGGQSAAALRALAALTRLEVWTDCLVSDVSLCVQHVAALTNLQRLSLEWAVEGGPNPGPAELLPLIGLRRLTHCDVILGYEHDGEIHHNQAGPGQPPDAWLQLLADCLNYSDCQPDAVAMAVQLAKQQAEQQAATLQQQPHQRRSQRLAQQQQRQQQQQLVTALWQQVAGGLPAARAAVQQLLRLLSLE